MNRQSMVDLMRAVNELSHLRKELAIVAAGEGSVAGMAMLSVLERIGQARVGQLACALHVDISVASRQVAQLEVAGYVERAPDPDDRRAQLVRVSDAGAVELEKWRDVLVEHFETALHDWTDEEAAGLTVQLQRLREALDRAAPPHRLSPLAPTAPSGSDDPSDSTDTPTTSAEEVTRVS